MFFALAICTAYGVGYNATRRKLYGLVAVLFVCLAGFISGAFQLAAFFKHQPVMGYTPLDVPNIGEWFLSFDFVHANRVIEGAVNHYPYYAYLVGDLHANVMDIPFQLMFITLVLSFLTKGQPPPEGTRADSMLKVVVLGLGLGFLLFVNTWGYPVFLAFFVLAFLLLRLDLGWKSFFSVIGVSLLAYLPYLLSRGTGAIQGLGLVEKSTDLIEFVEIFALFLFAMISLLLVLFRESAFTRRAFMAGAVFMFVVALVACLVHFQLILILAPLLLVPLYYIYKAGTREELHFMLLLAFTGALVILFFEVAFIDDALGPPNERYNTLLKMYMPVWVIWGLASAYGVYWVMSNLKGILRPAWAVLLVLLVLSALIHPLAATTSWASGRYALVEGSALTLDGLAYLESTNPGEYEAVRWLNENVEGSQVILEAPGEAMKHTSPVSAFTGLPTVLGWQGWEIMWGRSWDITGQRERAIDAIYEEPASEAALSLLDYYDVKYIYIGALEKKRYGEESLLEFARRPDLYRLVHESGGVSIFEVVE
jgi:YYY domain-containing protein